MLRQRFLWPIIIVSRSGEGTHSRSKLTGKPRQWYARISGNEVLIRQEGGNSDRRSMFGNAAMRFWVSIPIRRLVIGPKQPVFVRSRNNFGSNYEAGARDGYQNVLDPVVDVLVGWSCGCPGFSEHRLFPRRQSRIWRTRLLWRWGAEGCAHTAYRQACRRRNAASQFQRVNPVHAVSLRADDRPVFYPVGQRIGFACRQYERIGGMGAYPGRYTF